MQSAPIRWRLAFALLLCLPIAACGDRATPANDAGAPAATAATSTAAPNAPVPAPSSAETGTHTADVQAAVDKLAAELGEPLTAAYDEELAKGGDAPHAGLGSIAFLGQHLELATWLYGKGVLAEPDNADYLNNFAVGLHEKAILASTVTPDRPLLDLAVASLERAVALQAANATFHANLGYARLESWRTQSDAPMLQAAADALRKAVALDSHSATAWAHLAEVLAAQDDVAGAVEALEKARALAPFNGTLLATYPRLTPAVLDELTKTATGHCAIDYGCKAQCPRSIIGQVTYVTCEVAQSAAQGACEAGRPYAESFNCREQVPEFGILIPGLNSGFSLITPWGRVDMTVDGRGFVDFKAKAGATVVGPVSASISGKGSWDPASGFVEVKFKDGVSVGYKGSEAAKVASDHKMGPASISYDVGDETPKIKAYGGTILGH